MKGDPLDTRSYNHVDFKINGGQYKLFRKRILGLGLQIREDRSRIGGEGRSIYFYDDDNHLVRTSCRHSQRAIAELRCAPA